MKLHAGVGADILSAVDFPYPVVPMFDTITRTGTAPAIRLDFGVTINPDWRKNSFVVDCFDALTSDRPYRPRLSDDEAMKIVMDRRGTMYDPLIVDTFVKIHRDIAPLYFSEWSQRPHVSS